MRALPTWDDFLIACLRVLEDGEVQRRREIIEAAATRLNFTDEEKLVTIPSGQQTYVNRGNWAMTHLSKAGAVTSPQRAHWKITDIGRDLLNRFPDGITERQFRSELASGDEDAAPLRRPRTLSALVTDRRLVGFETSDGSNATRKLSATRKFSAKSCVTAPPSHTRANKPPNLFAPSTTVEADSVDGGKKPTG